MPLSQQLADDRDALLERLAAAVDGLGHALAQRAVVIDQGIADLGERQAAQLLDGVVGVDRAAADVVDQLAQRCFVHPPIVAAFSSRYRVRREMFRPGIRRTWPAAVQRTVAVRGTS